MYHPFIEAVISHGFSVYFILALLSVPILSMLVTFSRYVIGWKSYSMYFSLILTYALFDLSINAQFQFVPLSGLVTGGLLVVSGIIAVMGIQSLLKETQMQYLSKLALTFSISAFLAIILFYLMSLWLDLQVFTIDIMPSIVIILIVDIMIRNYLRKGLRRALILLFYTIALVLVLYGLIAIPSAQTFILRHPEVSIISLLITYIIGKWKGLRLTEYFRFREILTQDVEKSADN